MITGILFSVIIGFFVVGIVKAKDNNHSILTFPQIQEKNKSIIENGIVNKSNTNIESLETVDLVSNNSSIDTNINTMQAHLETPESVRALYMSAWTASSKTARDKLIHFISNSSLNAVVIDIKDATGRVSFLVDDSVVKDTGSPESKISDVVEFINELHQKNIYVIGRISVFQDPYLTKKYPDWAIQSITHKKPWEDRKGLSFLDPTNKQVWNYITALAIESYQKGFDEINFDYIRFPSDGNMKDIQYPIGSGTRADMMESFFIYLHEQMVKNNIPSSADLFGLTMEAVDDMGIGQILEKAVPNFDFIAPMIYPSHYGKGYSGFENPAEHPYQVVTNTMKEGVKRIKLLGFESEKFRPWIQDFDMGTSYGKEKVTDQIKALSDIGITSYMVWDPSNTYTRTAY